MKIIKNWKEIHSEQTDRGRRSMYELGSYRIKVVTSDYMPGGMSIFVSPINKDSYSPEIYVSCEYGREVQNIRIQTTAWGALDVSEIDKVIGAYAEAQMVAREIKMAFPECFEI